MLSRFWPGESPRGKRFSTEGTGGPFLEVVGVVQNGFYIIPGESPRPMVYVPWKQVPRTAQTLFVHTDTDPSGMVSAVRALAPDVGADEDPGRGSVRALLPAIIWEMLD